MKKFLVLISALFLVVGCSCSKEMPKDVVDKYLNDYKGLKDNVLSDIDTIIETENLDDDEKDIYRDILKKQYRDLDFKIEDESYDGDNANVTVKITVYDLYKATTEASTYLNNNPSEFLTNGEYDNKKYLDYKLRLMKDTSETVTYNIVIKTKKVDGKWQVEQPDEETLEKIHGIYNYEERS